MRRRGIGLWLAHMAAMGLLDTGPARGPMLSVGPEPHKFTPDEVEKIKADIRAKKARRRTHE